MRASPGRWVAIGLVHLLAGTLAVTAVLAAFLLVPTEKTMGPVHGVFTCMWRSPGSPWGRAW